MSGQPLGDTTVSVRVPMAVPTTTGSAGQRRPARPSAAGAALLSALIPGLGQMVKHQRTRGSLLLLTGAALVAAAWLVGQSGGRGADIFFLVVIVLPWWAIQSYDAFLPTPSGSPSLRYTLRTLLARAHDIRFLGALFLLTAIMDGYIIIANPAYSLAVFCAKPTGVVGALVKAQSPTLHVLIGYGFLRLRRWSLLLYVVYATFGVLNATANFACFGYGRVRMVFLLSLIGFTAYVLWRRHCFSEVRPAVPGL